MMILLLYTENNSSGALGFQKGFCLYSEFVEDCTEALSVMSLVNDPHDELSQLSGLVEIKNPYSARLMMISEAIRSRTFCLENKPDITAYQLKKRHDYFYQICELYCTNRDWCYFVVVTEKGPACGVNSLRSRLVENFHNKIKRFLFCSVLPELACARHHKGGIRE